MTHTTWGRHYSRPCFEPFCTTCINMSDSRWSQSICKNDEALRTRSGPTGEPSGSRDQPLYYWFLCASGTEIQQVQRWRRWDRNLSNNCLRQNMRIQFCVFRAGASIISRLSYWGGMFPVPTADCVQAFVTFLCACLHIDLVLFAFTWRGSTFLHDVPLKIWSMMCNFLL